MFEYFWYQIHLKYRAVSTSVDNYGSGRYIIDIWTYSSHIWGSFAFYWFLTISYNLLSSCFFHTIASNCCFWRTNSVGFLCTLRFKGPGSLGVWSSFDGSMSETPSQSNRKIWWTSAPKNLWTPRVCLTETLGESWNWCRETNSSAVTHKSQPLGFPTQPPS